MAELKQQQQDHQSNAIVLLDGGMGHELKLRGVSDSNGTFLAGVLANENLLQASKVESIHLDYFAAGCDVITTNSFVAVPRRMLECGLANDEKSASHRAATLIRLSVDRAKAAKARFEDAQSDKTRRQKKIAGCVPPLTECYFGEKVPKSTQEMVPEYHVIVSTLIECNVDIILAETLSTTREALAILQAFSKINTANKQIPVWVSFTVKDDNPGELRSGDSLVDACRQIITLSKSLKLPLEAIGVNCSAPSAISKALPYISPLLRGSEIKLCAYANCFQSTTSEWIESLKIDNAQDKTTKESQELTEDYDRNGYILPGAYAKYAIAWALLGVQIIGGCCGSRPQHMKQVARALRKNNRL